jgi:hypothetical protein
VSRPPHLQAHDRATSRQAARDTGMTGAPASGITPDVGELAALGVTLADDSGNRRLNRSWNQERMPANQVLYAPRPGVEETITRPAGRPPRAGGRACRRVRRSSQVRHPLGPR